MKKILVANRGEIALRIMRSIKKMGIKTVAVYSEPDRNAMHVRFADEAVCLGEAASSQSYLNMDKIIDFATKLGVDGIHPGYGFLSENAIFAEKVTKAGITFIGPEPASITLMGSKLAAKDCVKQYDIPMVPGTDQAITDIPEAQKIAASIGFPILIKASAGGGGKGMRVVEKAEDFVEQMDRAISEAKSAFGDGSVFIEKYVGSPRHIEVQVLGDKHGNIVHLFERECSIQRRHQKVIEEAPSGILTEEKRQKIGEAAVKVAKSCNYVGAGTVEFLLDENLDFYFLEMNTRLQVEHPVTEFITGIDLVEEQIKIARGEKLSFSQEDLKINGHAVELRVYAEDPLNDFLPSIGTITKYEKPSGEGVRLDDAYEEGMDIPIYYDPMIAKLVTFGKDRATAIQKMKEAIAAYKIEGFATTLPFGLFVMDHEAFQTANFDTHFVKKYFSKEQAQAWQKGKARKAALMALAHWNANKDTLKTINIENRNWKKR
ncbi:acetyl-CoA carboxylase biotin carboxylase subunit [Lacihabitans sp. LS3-19]|uniref:acetyl-CoA carboxylase biotin carboxylase subunit n=1 Tax=Lacihabitans sp. LS3-19 TaxID=2487335 RepID=UPI0020CC1175|nr:acetyl-CoA carboxylase biotin carboxylase subunit [Lacihabitans sp. LS3-19]MCP9768020.1 acetyl-CoA carboxylase biotin carboxylase subunit [Lacihabitans sp. LS3-19]